MAFCPKRGFGDEFDLIALNEFFLFAQFTTNDKEALMYEKKDIFKQSSFSFK